MFFISFDVPNSLSGFVERFFGEPLALGRLGCNLIPRSSLQLFSFVPWGLATWSEEDSNLDFSKSTLLTNSINKKTAKLLIDKDTKKYFCTYAESVLLRFTNEITTKTLENHLVSIEFTSIHFLFSLLLECNNNKSYEHIKKEERKYDDEADVVKRHLNLIVFYGSLILFCRVNCVIHSSADKYGEYWVHGIYLVNLITKFKGGLSMQLKNLLHLSVGDTAFTRPTGDGSANFRNHPNHAKV